jgi:aspartate aminotransferase
MAKLSMLAETMVGSEIVRLGNEISERKRRGEEIFNFTIGDFDPEVFPIPKELEKLIIESYQHHYTNYPPAEGVIELRTAVAQFLNSWEGLEYSTNEILIASGGRPLIYSLFKTVADENDKIIYAVPSWNNNHYTNLHKAQHCVVEATPENNFMPAAADIERHIDNAVLICLCTPQNPTGTTLSKQTLADICNLVIKENNKRNEQEKKLYLMFDQMYWTLTYGDIKHYNPVSLNSEMRKYTIFIDGISKAFAATGVRVGWAAGPQHVIQKMKAFLSHIGAWAPMAEQKATAKYLAQLLEYAKGPDSFHAHTYLLLLYAATGEKDKAFAMISTAIETKSSLLLFISSPFKNNLNPDLSGIAVLKTHFNRPTLMSQAFFLKSSNIARVQVSPSKSFSVIAAFLITSGIHFRFVRSCSFSMTRKSISTGTVSPLTSLWNSSKSSEENQIFPSDFEM